MEGVKNYSVGNRITLVIIVILPINFLESISENVFPWSLLLPTVMEI